jgi:hypothetical protein
VKAATQLRFAHPYILIFAALCSLAAACMSRRSCWLAIHSETPRDVADMQAAASEHNAAKIRIYGWAKRNWVAAFTGVSFDYRLPIRRGGINLVEPVRPVL